MHSGTSLHFMTPRWQMSNVEYDFPRESPSLADLLINDVREFAVFSLDPAGVVVSWSPSAARMLGYTVSDVVGTHFSRFHDEEGVARGEPDRLLAAAVDEGRVEVEAPRIRKDGTRFWANLVITPLYGDDGRHSGFVTVVRDMTVARATEMELRDRERHFADMQSLAGLGSWVWDIDTNAVVWSDELFRIYGLRPSGFGATVEAYLALVHPDDRERVDAQIEAVLRSGGSFGFVERIVRPDGAIRVLRSRGRAIRDATGRTIRLAGSCLDITELRQAQEQALELARAQAARSAAESTAVALRFLVRASELLAESLDYRAALADIAWLAVPQVVDMCAIDLVEPGGVLRRFVTADSDPRRLRLAAEYRERFPVIRGLPTWTALEMGEAQLLADVTDEHRVAFARDAEELELFREADYRSVIVVPLAGRGGVIGVLTLCQSESGRRFDEKEVWIARELGRHIALGIENSRLHFVLEERNTLLEHQAAELESRTSELQKQARSLKDVMGRLEAVNDELQQRTQEAEQANRAKAEFLAAMSHELRTPLNAIFGYADLLDLGLHGPITPPQHDALVRIKHNQRSLLALINDVLNFAKLEAGKLELHLDEVPVAEVIEDLDAVVEPQVRGKGLDYTCRIPAGNAAVRGERERIEQILLNLLTNAIKFTDRGGAIALTVDVGPAEVRFNVSDTGRGVPADRLDSIFDPFVQIERAPEELRERGVGLGLAISRDLAEAMGGVLSVRSVLGEGSTFTLTLPRTVDDEGSSL